MPKFELFSDSDEEHKKRRSSINKNRLSASECSDVEKKHGITTDLRESKKSDVLDGNDISDHVKENFEKISLNKINTIPVNTEICYKRKSGKVISNKYFKSYDIIKKEMCIGFYKNDRRNYNQSILDISDLYAKMVDCNIVGGAKKEDDKLKNSVLLNESDWDKIAPDTIISYRKKDQSMIYNARFNTYVITKKDNLTKMSLLSSTGQGFLANPAKIESIYRHFTSKDKTLAHILQTLKNLEMRVSRLEKK